MPRKDGKVINGSKSKSNSKNKNVNTDNLFYNNYMKPLGYVKVDKIANVLLGYVYH